MAHTLADLKRKAKALAAALGAADRALEARDQMILELADDGKTYAELAYATGLTQDGVTYVLRKVRRKRA